MIVVQNRASFVLILVVKPLEKVPIYLCCRLHSSLHLHGYMVKLMDIVFGALIKGMNCSKGVNIFCVKIPWKIYASRITFFGSMSSSYSFCCLTTKSNLTYNQQNKKWSAVFSLLGWKMGITLSIKNPDMLNNVKYNRDFFTKHF
jgi:hypothetical protein